MNKLEDIVSDFKSDSVNKSVVEELQKETNKNENFDFTFSCDDNKQHTPEQLDVVANMEGFVKDSIYGVHPHLLGSNLNKLLPPGLYNKLSEPLEAFEDLPISLTWCSVFMSVYRLSD
jgi:hypothetical protein